MNHIEQIIAANEELSAAIEQYSASFAPFSIGTISTALEEAQEDTKNEAKQGILAKISEVIAKVIAWFKNLIFKKKEDTRTAPVYDSEKFKKNMEEMFRKSAEHSRAQAEKMSKELDEALARARNLNSKEMQEKMRQDIAAGAERRRQEQASQIEKDVPGAEKTKEHWKKFIEPKLPEYLQNVIRDKCGLLTALAKGGEISKETVRFEDITAPIREFDNNLFTITENIRNTVKQVLRNLNNNERVASFVEDVAKSTKEVMEFAKKLEALGDIEPVAPKIDGSSINTIYRVVYDLSGKMPRSSIAGSVEILTKEMENLQKAVDAVKSVDGMQDNSAFKAIQDLIAKVIVPATVQAQKCARIVSDIFYNFQEIGTLINKHACNPSAMPSYKSFVEALRAEFHISDEGLLSRVALAACQIHGTNYLYPGANKN